MTDLDPKAAPPGQSVVRAPREGRLISFGDAGEAILKLVSHESADTLSAYEFAIPPATAGSPLHLYRTWDEAFYVLDGEMTFLIDGVISTASAGSFVFIPRGIPHTFWTESMTPAKQVTLFPPIGHRRVLRGGDGGDDGRRGGGARGGHCSHGEA